MYDNHPNYYYNETETFSVYHWYCLNQADRLTELPNASKVVQAELNFYVQPNN